MAANIADAKVVILLIFEEIRDKKLKINLRKREAIFAKDKDF